MLCNLIESFKNEIWFSRYEPIDLCLGGLAKSLGDAISLNHGIITQGIISRFLSVKFLYI